VSGQAVINEEASGDVKGLQDQIQQLKVSVVSSKRSCNENLNGLEYFSCLGVLIWLPVYL
jgi:hypothetical protein